MNKNYINLISATTGWALAGPIGAFVAILGIDLVGDYIEKKTTAQKKFKNQYSDLSICVLVLLKLVIISDNKIKNIELSFIRTYLLKEFGSKSIDLGIKAFNEIDSANRHIELKKICKQINENTTIEDRIQLVHVLFKAANIDKVITIDEEQRIRKIATYLKLFLEDYNAIKANYVFAKKKSGKSSYAKMHKPRLSSAYTILKLKDTCTNQELKKAFRTLAKSTHPDKFSYLGKEHAEVAEERFEKILEAYELIKAKRGIK